MKLFQQQQLILQIAIVVVVALLSSNDSNLFVAAQEFDRQADNNIEERNVTDVDDTVDAATTTTNTTTIVVNGTESPIGSPTDTASPAGSPTTGTLGPSPTVSPTINTDTPTDYYYGEDVPFRAFVEDTSRDTSSSAGINGLFLTLGASINNSTGDNNGDDNSKCSTGIYTDDNMMMHNIMHTIEPVYFNETTNAKPSITVSSYPEGLIESIIFGEDIESGTKFLRLKYNERMLLLVGVDLSSTDDDYEVNNDDYYGIWIQFPFDELNEIHLGGDIQVEVKDGFTNMTFLRATDRVHVDMSMSYNKNNTFDVRSSQNSNIVLDVGHYNDVDEIDGSENKKVKAIASDSSIMMISGTVEMIECFNNATCVVDGRIISKYCNDSLVAINATLETDDCSCVTVITTDPPININILTNTTTNDTSISAAYRAPPLFDFGASCVDTTYIPPIVAETNGPTTMNTIFSACPRPVSASVPIVVPVVPDEEELNTANNDTTTTTEDENEEEEEEGSPTLSTGGSTVPTGSYLDDQNIAIVWENNDSSSSSISMTIMTIATTIISAATMIIAIF